MDQFPGIPGAWEGDPKSIAKFLRFFHRQLQQIGFGVSEGEFVMVMKSITGECERAAIFAEGYAAGMSCGPPQDGLDNKREISA